MAKQEMIWIGCWDCGKEIQVAWIGNYSSRQICAECKEERAKQWELISNQ